MRNSKNFKQSKNKNKIETEKKFKSKIKTVADAFKARGLKVLPLSKFAMYPKRHRETMRSEYNLIIIAEALNAEANGGEDWIPDYTESSSKYELYWWIKADKKRPSGFGVSDADCADWTTDAIIGSRLCFINRDVALYCAKQFKKEWENWVLLKK